MSKVALYTITQGMTHNIINNGARLNLEKLFNAHELSFTSRVCNVESYEVAYVITGARANIMNALSVFLDSDEIEKLVECSKECGHW